RAVKSSEKPREIITDTLLKIPPNGASSLPTIQNLTQIINRERKKIKPFGKNEKSLIDLVIVDEFKYTKSGKKFLFFDSGNEDPERLIILSTDENIALLSYELCWFIDGTYEISPEVFTQDTIKAFNFIKEICPKEEQHLAECCLEQIKVGAEFKRDQREKKRDESIKNLYKEYKNYKNCFKGEKKRLWKIDLLVLYVVNLVLAALKFRLIYHQKSLLVAGLVLGIFCPESTRLSLFFSRLESTRIFFQSTRLGKKHLISYLDTFNLDNLDFKFKNQLKI
ncbi:hypothetical protein BpHYR1_008020, partial [Brachionus plicatilis]